MCSNTEMDRRKFWWNGKWGRLARRDVLLYEEGGVWWVEARQGGAEGRSRWLAHIDEDSALDTVRRLTSGPERWRDMG
jgi:hypothetical protein